MDERDITELERALQQYAAIFEENYPIFMEFGISDAALLKKVLCCVKEGKPKTAEYNPHIDY
ncbi:MAG: hypothetical protein RR115_07095 [Hydrogenoanaerobacterium sp.]